MTDSGNPNVMVTSNAVTVTVNAALTAPIVSVAQSAVDTGQSSTLSVSSGITGGTAPFSYQWMDEAPGASSYVSAWLCVFECRESFYWHPFDYGYLAL